VDRVLALSALRPFPLEFAVEFTFGSARLARKALEADLYALLDELNVAKDGTLVVPSAYLEVVITKEN